MEKRELEELLDKLEWTAISNMIKEASRRGNFFQDSSRDSWIREQLVPMVEKSIDATEKEFNKGDATAWVAHYTSSMQWCYDELVATESPAFCELIMSEEGETFTKEKC